MSPDHYAVLGVSPRASTLEIRQAYRRLVARQHVDRFGGGEGPALEATRRLNIARDTLVDPERRARFDWERATAPAPVWPTALRLALILANLLVWGLVLRKLLDGRRKPRDRPRA